MSAARVAKLEALLARVHSRRLAPGLRLVDAALAPEGAKDLEDLEDVQGVAPAPVAASVEAFDHDDDLMTPPPPAPTSSLMTLDEPVPRVAPAQSAALSDSAAAPTALDVEAQVAAELAAPEPVSPAEPIALAPAEAEDAFVTTVARPAPLLLDEPTGPLAASAAAALAPAPGAQAPAPVAPVAQASAPVELAQPAAGGPVVMTPPTPVASGPVASFVGAPQRTESLSFGELVGLAMSLTTR